MEHLPKTTLETLLAWGERERDAVLRILKNVPPDMEEYGLLQNRLEKLEDRLQVVRQQLAARSK